MKTPHRLDFESRIIGESKAIRAAIADLEKMADHRRDVLLVGETGTGKELFASWYASRCGRNLYKFDCTRLTAERAQSELHGHKKGAYTGADQDRKGIIARADGGVLFLDEIDKAPFCELPKLLRVLENRVVEPLGDDSGVQKKVDFQLVCAVSPDIWRSRDSGKFIPDLYYRIARRPIELPRLRDRENDVSILALHFLKRTAPEKEVIDNAWSPLRDYCWHGNVRDLRNFIEDHVALLATQSVNKRIVQEELADFQRRHKHNDHADRGTCKEDLVAYLEQLTDEQAADWLNPRSKDSIHNTWIMDIVAEDIRRQAKKRKKSEYAIARERYRRHAIGGKAKGLSPADTALRERLTGKRK